MIKTVIAALLVSSCYVQGQQKCSHAKKDKPPTIELGYECQEEFTYELHDKVEFHYQVAEGQEFDVLITVENLDGHAQLLIPNRYGEYAAHSGDKASYAHSQQYYQLPWVVLNQYVGQTINFAVEASTIFSNFRVSVTGAEHAKRMAQTETDIVEEIVNECCTPNDCNYFDMHLNGQGKKQKDLDNNTTLFIDLCQDEVRAHCTKTGHLQTAHFALDEFQEEQYLFYFQCPFPSAIGKLQQLETLDLRGHPISGDLSDVIEILKEMPKLKEVYLDKTQITGSIPCSITELKNVELLSLNELQLQGDLPDCIFDMPKLRVLSASDSKLTGTISEAKPDKLEILNLEDNNLEGSLPDLSKFKKLAHLVLSHNKFEGSLPLLPESLTYLKAYRNDLTGKLPANLFSLPGIIYIDLEGNDLEGNLPSKATSPHLINVYLSDNKLTGPIPPALATLPSLKVLQLNENNLDGTLAPFAASLAKQGETKLIVLDVSTNNLKGEIPAQLDSMASGGIYHHVHTQNMASSIIALDHNEFTGPIPIALVKRALDCTGGVPGSISTAGNNVECPVMGELPELNSVEGERAYCPYVPKYSKSTKCMVDGEKRSLFELVKENAETTALGPGQEVPYDYQFLADGPNPPIIVIPPAQAPVLGPENVNGQGVEQGTDEDVLDADDVPADEQEVDEGEEDNQGVEKTGQQGMEKDDGGQQEAENGSNADDSDTFVADTVSRSRAGNSQTREVVGDQQQVGDQFAREGNSEEGANTEKGGKKGGNKGGLIAGVIVAVVVAALVAVVGVVLYKRRPKYTQYT